MVTYTTGLRLLGIDDFVTRLWETHLAVKKEGYAQVCEIR
jgi:hypothetical protein